MAACLSSLSSTGTALQASIFEAKGMVRERRARGFNLGASRRGLLLKKEGATGGLRARGELYSGNERVRRGLGGVEEGMGVLTVEAIELRWPRGGDRRECSAFGKNRGGGIRARRKTSGGLRSLVSSVVAWRAARGTIYRQGEAVEGRTRWPASTAVLCQGRRREGCSEVGLGSGRHGVASAVDEAAQRRRDASGRRRCRAVLCGRQRRAEARRVLATCCSACGEDGVAARGAGLQRRELGRGAVRPSTRAGGLAVWSTRARGTARRAACWCRGVCGRAGRGACAWTRGGGLERVVLKRAGGAGLARRLAAVVRRGRRGSARRAPCVRVVRGWTGAARVARGRATGRRAACAGAGQAAGARAAPQRAGQGRHARPGARARGQWRVRPAVAR